MTYKKNYSSPKRKVVRKKNFSFGRIMLYVFFLITLIIISLGVYQFKDGLLYYLGFKTTHSDGLSDEERKIADIRIYEVLSEHQDFIFGMDVSEYQGDIDWVKSQKVEDTFALSFVFIRATAGKNKVDSKFKKNWKEAKKNNFVRGAYHYYRPNENSIQQANNFIKTVKLSSGDFPPVLDIEKLPRTQSLDSLKVGLKRWLTKVEKHYKMKPIIYSGESYYKDFLRKEFSDYPFWIANYNLWKKKPEKEWLMWQFTEKAKVEGIKGTVDLNVFNGDFVKFIEATKP
ncbi:Glycoside hydrolase [Flavobacterium sp. 9AF]|uniref:glycoside hydrolase family 25 protein n=1 Tax=Flavobacterium sp. 9AF TaxID=2653142 RepID=UPI0012F3100E|nr:glycoside hydrolase family 25 protein [Flavobacterium sp. 9AF]VXC32100.1 Glycoside hydrolase [Flavobacterium sp. 9AF]